MNKENASNPVLESVLGAPQRLPVPRVSLTALTPLAILAQLALAWLVISPGAWAQEASSGSLSSDTPALAPAVENRATPLSEASAPTSTAESSPNAQRPPKNAPKSSRRTPPKSPPPPPKRPPSTPNPAPHPAPLPALRPRAASKPPPNPPPTLRLSPSMGQRSSLLPSHCPPERPQQLTRLSSAPPPNPRCPHCPRWSLAAHPPPARPRLPTPLPPLARNSPTTRPMTALAARAPTAQVTPLLW